MSLTHEYQKQFAWRDWNRAFGACPIISGQHVLDLGCGPGDLSAELVRRGAIVTGIDGNTELLTTAQNRHLENATFIQGDLNSLNLESEKFDGLWCSFTAAYFTEFEKILQSWTRFLKKSSWLGIVEMDDLFGHLPLSEKSRELIEKFYSQSFKDKKHDFRAGRKLKEAIEKNGFNVNSFTLMDQELSFQGPATPEVLQAWTNRLNRMNGLKTFLGEDFNAFKEDFIQCLSSPDHQSQCQVICCIGVR